MRHLSTILSHEIRVLLFSPSTYVAAVLFLSVMGFIFSGILDTYSAPQPQETSPAAVFFQLFFLPVLFIVPLLTMKCLAEERRMGTLETLLTTPVSTTEVVLGKFGAAYFLYMMLWAATGGFFVVLHRFASAPGMLDSAPIVGGYVFVALSGLFFVAIGVLASAMSRNQAIAGIVSFTLLFCVIVGVRYLDTQAVLDPVWLAPIKDAVDYAQVFQHLDDFTRGIVDMREVLYYLSGCSLTLILSILIVEAKLLHS